MTQYGCTIDNINQLLYISTFWQNNNSKNKHFLLNDYGIKYLEIPFPFLNVTFVICTPKSIFNNRSEGS